MASTKFHLKFGSSELCYEGPEEFLKTELAAFLAAFAQAPQRSAARGAATSESKDSTWEPSMAQNPAGIGVETVAAKLGARSGADLAMAAAYQLVEITGEETFSRQSLLEEMKSAPSFYKIPYRNNLSATLSRLVASGTLTEKAAGVYSIQSDALSKLRQAVRR